MSDHIDSNHDDFDGYAQQVLAALVAGGSSGGARPKAQIYMPSGEIKRCRTFAQRGDEVWLIKFTSKHLALGHVNEHATAFGGYGKAPPIKVMQKLAASAGYGSWNEARQVVEEVSQALSQFAHLAQQQGISKTTVSAITKTLDQRKQENAALFLQQ